MRNLNRPVFRLPEPTSMVTHHYPLQIDREHWSLRRPLGPQLERPKILKFLPSKICPYETASGCPSRKIIPPFLRQLVRCDDAAPEARTTAFSPSKRSQRGHIEGLFALTATLLSGPMSPQVTYTFRGSTNPVCCWLFRPSVAQPRPLRYVPPRRTRSSAG